MATATGFEQNGHLEQQYRGGVVNPSSKQQGLVYLSRFGMNLSPFSTTPDPRFFMQSETHLNALASMIYGIRERKGFITLTGPVGTGKTTLLNVLLNSLDMDVIFSRIIFSDLSFFELLQMICTDLGMKVGKQTKVELINELFHFLVENRIQGRNALVVIDEAQKLGPGVLESLRQLSNLETAREKLLQILLVGQPELKANLAVKELRQLAQRIVVNCELKMLSPKEAQQYIYHRLSVAGLKGDTVFPQSVANRIAEISKGTPRIINIICDNCLMQSFANNSHVISDDILAKVEEEYFAVYNPALSRFDEDDSIEILESAPVEDEPVDISSFLEHKQKLDAPATFMKGEKSKSRRKKIINFGRISIFGFFMAVWGLFSISASRLAINTAIADATCDPLPYQAATNDLDSVDAPADFDYTW